MRDLYAKAVDYDPKGELAQLFFRKVQNKMLWAVTGKTAAEIITERANPAMPKVGLQTWSGRRVLKQDVGVGKNYLHGPEIQELDRIVVMYLDYAEDQAKRRKTMTMEEWESRLDAFLKFNERDLLAHAGKVRAEVAEKLALERYAAFDGPRKALERERADKDDLEAIESLQRRLPPKAAEP